MPSRMCLRDRPRLLGPAPIGPLTLGGDHHLVALGEVLQRLAGDPLALALGIDVGGVEEVDPGLDRLLEERQRVGSSSSTQERHFDEP